MKRYFAISVGGQTYDVTVEEKEAPVVQADQPATESPNKLALAGMPQSSSNGESKGIPVKAPMSGKILAVLVQDGELVERGQPLLVLEALKMENDIVAAQDGTIQRVLVQVDQSVETGQDLVLIASRPA